MPQDLDIVEYAPEAGVAAARVFERLSRTTLAAAAKSGMPEADVRAEKEMLPVFPVYPFRGARVWAVLNSDQLAVSIHMTRFSSPKSREGAWGRYCNFNLAYTLATHRRRGYATELLRHVEALARAEGVSRMKSLVKSWGGFRLHWRAGHQFWGLTEDGELQIDTPLDPNQPFPNTVPRLARAAVENPHLMEPGELFDVITNPKGLFRADPAEAKEVLWG
jgi:GNAT superfamily N-acetyltransferase